MASPSTALSTYRPDLAGSLQEYNLASRRLGFIANQVAPVLNVASPSGTFGRIPVEQLLQTADTKRAPGGDYNRGDIEFEPDTFVTKEAGFEMPVDDNDQAMYADYFDAEQMATLRAFDALLTRHEKNVADAIFNSTTWTGDLTTAVVNEWDDEANATPIDDIEAAADLVYARSGLWPNALIIGRKGFRNLRRSHQIIEEIQAGGAGESATLRRVTPEKLAEVFDLERILVGGAVQNSAALGQAASLADLWSPEYAMVAHIDFSGMDDVQRPTLARTFHWAEDGSQVGGRVETYREEKRRADIVRVRHQVGIKVMYPEAGHLLSNIKT